MEAQLEKEARMKQLHAVGHNHSRDSAIDADLQEWETETFDMDMVSLVLASESSFLINIYQISISVILLKKICMHNKKSSDFFFLQEVSQLIQDNQKYIYSSRKN